MYFINGERHNCDAASVLEVICVARQLPKPESTVYIYMWNHAFRRLHAFSDCFDFILFEIFVGDASKTFGDMIIVDIEDSEWPAANI